MERELRSARFNRYSDDFKVQNPWHFQRWPTSGKHRGIGNNRKWLESQWWPSTEIDGRPMNSNHSRRCHDDKFLFGYKVQRQEHWRQRQKIYALETEIQSLQLILIHMECIHTIGMYSQKWNVFTQLECIHTIGMYSHNWNVFTQIECIHTNAIYSHN